VRPAIHGLAIRPATPARRADTKLQGKRQQATAEVRFLE